MEIIISYIKSWELLHALLLSFLCRLFSSSSWCLYLFPISSRVLHLPIFPSYFLSTSPGFSLSSPLFNETVFSYAVVPWPQSSQSYLSFMEFEVTFHPSMPDGTLLYSDDTTSGDFLAINLVDRYVEFRFDCGSGGATIRLLFSVSFFVSTIQYIF